MRAGILVAACALWLGAGGEPTHAEVEITTHGASLLMTSNFVAKKGLRTLVEEDEELQAPAHSPENMVAPELRAVGGALPLPAHRASARASFIQEGAGKMQCAPPAGETCVCDWNPSFQCYYAPNPGDSCQCWGYSESACTSRGGSFCTRPESCVANCDLCKDESTCQQCVSGYMAVGGLCTKEPASYAEQALKTHNIYRCVHGVPALTWSSAAAASAQSWANSLTSLVHSDSYGEAPPAGPAGENLARGYSTIVAASTGWYNEEECCTRAGDGSYSDGCKTGSCATGHFTAMVWQGVTELGCARNSANKIDVCRYRSGDRTSKNTANMGGYYVEMVNEKAVPLDQCIAQFDGAAPSPTPMPTMAPTPMPTPMPTAPPTPAPTMPPTPMPTPMPTMAPTMPPTPMPTPMPTIAPTPMPTPAPTMPPTPMPTMPPTAMPTPMPTMPPTPMPTMPPTAMPTPMPTMPPTEMPTPMPTTPPTPMPTMLPTEMPTPMPTMPPTEMPTPMPTMPPTEMPTPMPTMPPTEMPTPMPTMPPMEMPSPMPTMPPTEMPTPKPTMPPTEMPTPMPTTPPTEMPTPQPTMLPTPAPMPPTAPPTTESPSTSTTMEPTTTRGRGGWRRRWRKWRRALGRNRRGGGNGEDEDDDEDEDEEDDDDEDEDEDEDEDDE